MAVMLPVAIGMAGSEGAERSYSPSAPPSHDFQTTDQNSQGTRQLPQDSTEAAGTQQQATGGDGIDAKREGQDSSDDHGSVKATWTRPKSNSSSTGKAGSAASAANAGAQFASVFADALTNASGQLPTQASSPVAPLPHPVPFDAAAQSQGVEPVAASAVGTAGPAAATASSSTPSETQSVVSIAALKQSASSESTESQASAAPAQLKPLSGGLSTGSAPTVKAGANRQSNDRTVLAGAAATLAASPEKLGAGNHSAADAGLQAALAAFGLDTAQPDLQCDAAFPAASVQTAQSAPASVPSVSAMRAVLADSSTDAPRSTGRASSPALFGSLTLQTLQPLPDRVDGVAAAGKHGDGANPQSDTGTDTAGSQAMDAPRRDDQGPAKALDAGDSAASTFTASLSAAAPNSQAAAPVPSVAAIAQSGIQERIDVARQLADRIAASGSAVGLNTSSSAVHKLSVDITPQHWGRMQITVTQSPADAAGNSQATATIVTETESARQALLGQVKELRDSLQSSGVKLNKIEIVSASKSAAATIAPADSVVAGAASASSGSLAGNAQQGQQQSQQRHDHASARFEYSGGSSSAGADTPGGSGQGSRPPFYALPTPEPGGPRQPAGSSQRSDTEAISQMNSAQSGQSLAADSGINMLA